MSEHLPGPYTVGGLQQNIRVSGYRIVGCGATVAIVIAGTGRAEATSNLIAAAPDLLAACKLAESELKHRVRRETCQGRDTVEGVFDALRDAIAKAGGAA